MSVYNVNGTEIMSVYGGDGAELNYAFNKNGDTVHSKGSGAVDYDSYTMASLHNESTWLGNCQGIAIHNGVLFQFRTGPDVVTLFDFSDWSVINASMSIDSDHGDSATFSTEFYNVNDEFPLIYVTADTTPAIIYVNRVTRSTATLIKTLKFSQSAGYYGAGAFDWENNICYLLAYKENNYQTDGGGTNTTVVSKWDLTNLTDNGDGTYTPAFVSQYERAFIYVMQGLTFHDGMIWISSGYGGSTSYVYAMEPSTGEILHTITMDTTEVEGIQFVYDSVAQSYYLVTGQQGGKYKKYTFAIE